MGYIIKQIKPGGEIDLERSYVGFKNNCPLDEPLYDDFGIADIETDATLFIVQIDIQKYDLKYKVFEKMSEFVYPFFQSNSAKEFIS